MFGAPTALTVKGLMMRRMRMRMNCIGSLQDDPTRKQSATHFVSVLVEGVL